MKEILLIKYLLARRSLERGWYNLTHSRPVVVNKDRRKLLKLAGIGAAGIAISALGADKLLGKQVQNLDRKGLASLNIIKRGKKLLFLNKRGKEVLEIS